MGNNRSKSAAIYNASLVGLTLSISPIYLILIAADLEAATFSYWRLVLVSLTLLSTFVLLFTWKRYSYFAQMMAILMVASGITAAWPNLTSNPFATFTVIIVLSFIGFAFVQKDRSFYEIFALNSGGIKDIDIGFTLGTLRGFAALFIISWLIGSFNSVLEVHLCACGGIICQYVIYKWGKRIKSRLFQGMLSLGLVVICLSFLADTWLCVACMVFILLIDLLLINSFGNLKLQEEMGLHFFLNRPARLMFTTFVLLCTLGSIFLYLPMSLRGHVQFIDAAFVAVSASCVTGLTTLNISQEFSAWGQFFVICLVQLGSLGIMSVASLAMQAMGRRLSLRHERMLASITETDQEQYMMRSLMIILAYVFGCELVGAIVLFVLFKWVGESWSGALGKGVFTAISAFCNAGMTLTNDNMMSYTHNSAILLTVAFLIFLGSMAPATSLAVIDFVKGKRIGLTSYLAIITTLIVFTLGTFSFAAAEWDNTLAGLNWFEKLVNSLFMAISVRSAGFNSIDMSHCRNVTAVIDMCLMMVGGSPGGVAGGIKTVTLAVLFLVFWAEVTHSKRIICGCREISRPTVHRAISTVMAFGFLIFLGLLVLLSTQNVAVRSLLFEVVSAVATVGASLGATNHVDELGKSVLMFLMFCGRIGPITLFFVMSNEKSEKDTVHYPEEKLSLS